jgi:hypothetical protein
MTASEAVGSREGQPTSNRYRPVGQLPFGHPPRTPLTRRLKQTALWADGSRGDRNRVAIFTLSSIGAITAAAIDAA